MKYGPAATHGIEVHNTQPIEVRIPVKAKMTKMFLEFFTEIYLIRILLRSRRMG